MSQSLIEENFCKLKALICTMSTSKTRIDYLRMINGLAEDVKEGEIHYLGMKRAPAASNNHHAREGGLVIHLLEMWNAWLTLRSEYTELIKGGKIDDDKVVQAIIHHDLHKAYRTYSLETEDPWKAVYVKGEGRDSLDTLLPQDLKSMQILQSYGIELSPEMMHVLIWSEGGWSLANRVYPRVDRSALAVLAYLLDEFSGNVLDKLR